MPLNDPIETRRKSPDAEPKKQVSLFLPLSRYRALRDEAARKKVPMVELVRGWVRPHLEELVKDKEDP